MNMIFYFMLCAVLVLSFFGSVHGAVDEDTARGEWFKEAKYAMFVHWGTYSVLGGKWHGKTYYGIGEWIQHMAKIPVAEYEKVAGDFNPVKFDADEWAKLAKAAGMKYIVITAKHHEGFAMFDSKVSDYNIVDASPYGRDPLKELAAACKRHGLKLGFYYSQYQDWHEPDAAGNDWDFGKERNFDKYLHEKAIPQVKELLTNYGPLAMIWFDTPGSISLEDSIKLKETVRRLQPGCLINGRIGHGLGDYKTLGDSEIPLQPKDGLWEAIDTHNDSWAYVWYDTNFKSASEIVSRLVRVISKGGNYMLNVGPTGLGEIPEVSARHLKEAGGWIARNSESIYGTKASPLGQMAWGDCTMGKGKLYLHVLDWPSNGKLWVPGLSNKIKKAYPLEAPGCELGVSRTGCSPAIDISQMKADPIATVIVLEVDGEIGVSRGLTVMNGLVNRMEAPYAEVENCEAKRFSWMEKFGDWHYAETVTGWKGIKSSAKWTFAALEKGSFYIDITYSCPESASRSEWFLELGEFKASFPLIDSGSKKNLLRYRTYRIGLVDIDGPGNYELVLRSGDEKGSEVSIERFSLIPVR